MKPSSPEHFWQQRARALQRRVNAGWLWQKLTPLLAVAALAGSAAIIGVRSYWPAHEPLAWLVILPLCLLLPLALAYAKARRHFESRDSALVRLESSYQLHNALSSATAGHSDWPPVPASLPASPLRWKLPRTLLPGLLSLSLLSSAALIPIEPVVELPVAHAEPTLWLDLEADAKQLEQERKLDSEYPRSLQEKVDQLRSQKREDWYSHASQEAAAQLKKDHQREVGNLQEAARKARQALAGLQAQKLQAARREKLAEQFQQAVEQMGQGQLKPNQDLLKKLQQANPEALKQALDPEQMRQLQQQLQELNEGLQELGPGQDAPPRAGDKPGDEDGGGRKGEGEDGADGWAPGDGAPQRGPGDGGDPSGPPRAPAKLQPLTPLQAHELNPELGDQLQELQGEHEVDPSPHRQLDGGDAHFRGQGGERILRNRLTDPKERALLKKYFSEEP